MAQTVIENDQLESTSSVIGTVGTLIVLSVVSTSAARFLVVVCTSVADNRMSDGLEGADMGVFDG